MTEQDSSSLTISPVGFDDPIDHDSLNRDQERIKEWHSAAMAAPTVENILEYRSSVEQAEKVLGEKRAEYEKAVAQRALVYGWQKVSTEERLTPKRLHSWWRKHCYDLQDLSSVPTKEMSREERRITSEQKLLSEADLLRERVLNRKALLDEMRKGFNR